MRSAFFLPFVLLLGLVIGGWAPKEELRALKTDMDKLRAKLAENDKTQRFDALTRIAQIPDRAKQPKLRPAPQSTNALERATATQASNVAARLSVATAPSSPPSSNAMEQTTGTPRPEDLRARIDEAKELWKTRVEIARAQWIQKLRLSEDDTAKLDNAINAMNENLYAVMQSLASGVASAETLTPETGVRSFNEMTSVLVSTYDEINAFAPPELQGEIANMELTDFIDPAIAEPLVSVQDKIDNAAKEQHRHGVRFGR